MYLDPRIGADEKPKYLIIDDDGNDVYVDSLAPLSPFGHHVLKVPGHREKHPHGGKDQILEKIPHNAEVEEEPGPVVRNLDEEEVDEDIDEDFIINEEDEEIMKE